MFKSNKGSKLSILLSKRPIVWLTGSLDIAGAENASKPNNLLSISLTVEVTWVESLDEKSANKSLV